ncbi:MAG: hypothetical protein DRH24_15965, partial [Deltaproteobacteria bacterium]
SWVKRGTFERNVFARTGENWKVAKKGSTGRILLFARDTSPEFPDFGLSGNSDDIDENKKFLTVKEFSELCGVKESAIRHWIQNGEDYFNAMSKRYTGESWDYVRGFSPASFIFIKKTEPEFLQNTEYVKGNIKMNGRISPPAVETINGKIDIILERLKQLENRKSGIGGIEAIAPILPSLIQFLIPIIKNYIETKSKTGNELAKAFREGLGLGLSLKEEDEIEPEPEKKSFDINEIMAILPMIAKMIKTGKNEPTTKNIENKTKTRNDLQGIGMDGGFSDEAQESRANTGFFEEPEQETI